MSCTHPLIVLKLLSLTLLFLWAGIPLWLLIFLVDGILSFPFISPKTSRGKGSPLILKKTEGHGVQGKIKLVTKYYITNVTLRKTREFHT